MGSCMCVPARISTGGLCDVFQRKRCPVQQYPLANSRRQQPLHPPFGSASNFQGQGIARQLMDYAEAHAQQEKCTAVRLDTFSKNPRNQRFYKARGYQQLGDVFFPKQSEYPFHCFEKILTY